VVIEGGYSEQIQRQEKRLLDAEKPVMLLLKNTLKAHD